MGNGLKRGLEDGPRLKHIFPMSFLIYLHLHIYSTSRDLIAVYFHVFSDLIQ